jgi:hypothetical protein
VFHVLFKCNTNGKGKQNPYSSSDLLPNPGAARETALIDLFSLDMVNHMWNHGGLQISVLLHSFVVIKTL